MTTTSPKLIPQGPLARGLRVPAKWLREEALAGRVPHLKTGQVILFDPETVERVLVERARQEGGDHAT
jgi:hypothetical protein